MNKKIKIIDLLQMFHKKEKMPQKIKVSCYEFEYDEEVNAYFNLDKNSNNQSLIQNWLNNASKLNNEVEILEVNTEEIEEIPEERIEICTDRNYAYLATKYNELVKAIKEIRKDLNK